MGKFSKISYVDSSWSPWIGCTPVSAACDNCYARVQQERYGHDFSTVRRASNATFYAPLKWEEPKRIFVCELSDFFHPGADEWRTDAWDIIRQQARHTYLILTKRPERWGTSWSDWPWPNVWLGVTAENQEMADLRIPLLLGTYPAKRFLSIEPCLSSVKIPNLSDLSQVIVGAESGPNRREMKLEWIEDVVRQCKAANVPVYVKQGSHLYPGRQGDIPDSLWKIKEMPDAE